MMVIMKPIQEYSKDIQDVIRRKRQYVRQRGLKHFSIDEIVLMLEEQERQQGKINLELFQGYMCTANKAQGGFDWDKTEQGYEFWFTLIMGEPRRYPICFYTFQQQAREQNE